MTDSSGTKNNENQVDLGLLGLLDSEKEKPASTPSIPEPTNGNTNVSTPQFNSTKPESAFEQLWRTKEFAKLIENVEPAIDDQNKAGIIARLWWGRAQIAKGDLPISFLAAPLETALKQAVESKTDTEITSLANAIAQELMHKLSTSGDEHAGLLDLCKQLGADLKVNAQTEIPKTDANSNPSKIPAWAMGVKVDDKMPVTRMEKGKRKSFNSEVVQGRGSGKRALLFAGIIFALLFLGAYFLLTGLDLKLFAAKEPVVAPEKVALQVPADSSMRAPEPTKMQKVGSLGAIFYDMASATAAPKPTLGNAAQDASSTKAVEVPKVTAKTQVNTDGPVEPPQFQEKLTKPERSPVLNGQPEGYPVEKLPEAKTFQVLAKTPVLSEPTEYGRVLGQLMPGDKVLVEAKVGVWLRLRSKKGRGGFVRAENISEVVAEEENDRFKPVLPPQGR